MSNKRTKIASLILALCMMLSLCSGAFAVNEKTIALSDTYKTLGVLVDRLIVSDGYESDKLTSDLMSIFFSDPNRVMDTLKGYDKSAQKLVIEALAYQSVAYSETRSFDSAIDKLEWTELKEQTIEFYNSIKDQSIDNLVSDIYMPEYDPTIIKEFVDTYQKMGFLFDEEFYAKMVNVYSTDVKVFSKIVSDLSSKEMDRVALGMAVTAQNHKDLKLSSRVDVESKLTDDETKIMLVMDSAIKKAVDMMYTPDIEKAAMITFGLDIQAETAVEAERAAPKAAPKAGNPTIGGMSWSNLNVGAQAKLSVPINDAGNYGTTRTYTIKVYCMRDGTWWLKHSGYNLTMASTVSSSTVSIPVVFSDAGTFFTRVEIYRGNTKIGERTGSTSDVIRGNWRINVDLPSNRTYEGALGIYNAGGTRVKPVMRCLGRSASNASMATPNGNTPTGDNTATLGPVQSDTAAYGPHKVVMLVAKPGHSYSNRTDIYIHGGRSQTALAATNGCVRVFNSDQKIIQDTLTSMMSAANGHNTTGQCIIQQI